MASSSRFATISEAQLDELVENKEAKNTKRELLKPTCKKRTKSNRKPRQKSAMY